MLPHCRSVRFMTALAGGVSGLALIYTHPAAAQQADQRAPESGGLEEIVVAARPNDAGSVQLLGSTQSTPSGPPTSAGATVAESKTPTSGLEGFIEGGIGSNGQKSMGGAVSVPMWRASFYCALRVTKPTLDPGNGFKTRLHH